MRDLTAGINQNAARPATANADPSPIEKRLGQDLFLESLERLPIQRKLTIGAVDEPLEREADAVADLVMRTPEPVFIQRKYAECVEGDEKLARWKQLEPFVQREVATVGGIASDTAIESRRGDRSPMRQNSLSFMAAQARAGTQGQGADEAIRPWQPLVTKLIAVNQPRIMRKEEPPLVAAPPAASPELKEIEAKPEPEGELGELIRLTDPKEHAQSSSPEVGMTKTVAEAFKYILEHWSEFQFDEAYLDGLKIERGEQERRLKEIREPFTDKQKKLAVIGKTLAKYLALGPKTKQGELGLKTLDDLAAQEAELERLEISIRKAEEKPKGWTRPHQQVIKQQIQGLAKRKPGPDEKALMDRIGAIAEIERSARGNFADAKKWIDRVRKGYKATVSGSQDADELAAGELASMSTEALCNVISYWLYGTATKLETRTFPEFFREEMQRGMIKAQGVRFKGELIAVKGIYYGTGSGEWRHRWGMRSLVNESMPLSHAKRKQEREDFLSSNATLAISWQSFRGGAPHHFLLIYKDADGWHNLDHTATSAARRFGATQWSQVFGVYFSDENEKAQMREMLEYFFGDYADTLWRQIFGSPEPVQSTTNH